MVPEVSIGCDNHFMMMIMQNVNMTGLIVDAHLLKKPSVRE